MFASITHHVKNFRETTRVQLDLYQARNSTELAMTIEANNKEKVDPLEAMEHVSDFEWHGKHSRLLFVISYQQKF
jgi:hypothetical protein